MPPSFEKCTKVFCASSFCGPNMSSALGKVKCYEHLWIGLSNLTQVRARGIKDRQKAGKGSPMRLAGEGFKIEKLFPLSSVCTGLLSRRRWGKVCPSPSLKTFYRALRSCHSMRKPAIFHRQTRAAIARTIRSTSDYRGKWRRSQSFFHQSWSWRACFVLPLTSESERRGEERSKYSASVV